MAKQEIGVIGMAVMGQNLALNIESKGFSAAVFNRTASKTEEFAAGTAAGKNILPTYSFEEFANSLQTPRRIILMVKAGEPVDDMIEQVKPFLAKGDILMDGGNSFFLDTERRQKQLEAEGLQYIGMGVSGGEEGARLGPCIMPGGPASAYKHVEPILTKIAAQVDDGPCCAHIGESGAGHYVKMIHNGIEYGIMQAISEAYDMLCRRLLLTPAEASEVFGKWNEEELGGYLMEIATLALSTTDPDTGKALVDVILDKAGQKGTGKWMSQNAFDIGAPVPTIDSAVIARVTSAFKDERVAASKILTGPPDACDTPGCEKKEDCIAAVRDALLATMITSYAQGMAQLRLASAEYGYKLNFAQIAQIWKGGCIIRAKLLEPIKQAYLKTPNLANLLVEPTFAKKIISLQDGWRKTVIAAIKRGVPVLTISSSLAYFDSYRSERLPANMIQALRDIFGAHTYKRLDKEGDFHTEWLK